MSETDKIINAIINVVDRNAPGSEIYLYGSRARGEATKFSDWDLLILLNKNNISFDFETKFLDDFYQIELETAEIISPLMYSKQDWQENYSITPLFESIQKDGIRLR
jgi:uncharacterized protein